MGSHGGILLHVLTHRGKNPQLIVTHKKRNNLTTSSNQLCVVRAQLQAFDLQQQTLASGESDQSLKWSICCLGCSRKLCDATEAKQGSFMLFCQARPSLVPCFHRVKELRSFGVYACLLGSHNLSTARPRSASFLLDVYRCL